MNFSDRTLKSNLDNAGQYIYRYHGAGSTPSIVYLLHRVSHRSPVGAPVHAMGSLLMNPN